MKKDGNIDIANMNAMSKDGKLVHDKGLSIAGKHTYGVPGDRRGRSVSQHFSHSA